MPGTCHKAEGRVASSRWYHQRTRLTRDAKIALIS